MHRELVRSIWRAYSHRDWRVRDKRGTRKSNNGDNEHVIEELSGALLSDMAAWASEKTTITFIYLFNQFIINYC